MRDTAPERDPWLDAVLDRLAQQRALAEGAMGQCTWAQLCTPPWPGQNAVATIVRHLAGNMRSRFTDYLKADGEKPGRDRDAEFTDAYADRAEMEHDWARGWAVCTRTLESLTPDDLRRTVAVRGEPLTVPESLLRHVAHVGYHVGQVVTICKRHVGPEDWRTLSIPPGGSAAYERRVRESRNG